MCVHASLDKLSYCVNIHPFVCHPAEALSHTSDAAMQLRFMHTYTTTVCLPHTHTHTHTSFLPPPPPPPLRCCLPPSSASTHTCIYSMDGAHTHTLTHTHTLCLPGLGASRPNLGHSISPEVSSSPHTHTHSCFCWHIKSILTRLIFKKKNSHFDTLHFPWKRG